MIETHVRFAGALVRTSVRAAIADRGAFAMRAALMALNNGIFFTFWIVLLTRVPSVRGYELGDMAVLYGIVAMGHGLGVIFAGGYEHLAQTIYDGELDSLLAQPKPTLLYALGMRAQAAGFGDVVSGAIMIALSGRVTVLGIPLVHAAAIAAGAVLVSTGVMLHSAAFWLGRTDTASRQMYESTLIFSLYPDTLFGGPIRLMMFTILPAGFVGYIPSTLIRTPTLGTGAIAYGAAAVYVAAAIWVFRRGLRSYSSGSRFATLG